jgi:phage-related protein
MGSSLDELRAYPEGVQDVVGYALYLAQQGRVHPLAKPLTGQLGGLMEVVADHAGNAYRSVYTLKLRGAVYVLHVFQKKSKRGIATPRHVVDLILRRRRQAAAHYATHYGKEQ